MFGTLKLKTKKHELRAVASAAVGLRTSEMTGETTGISAETGKPGRPSTWQRKNSRLRSPGAGSLCLPSLPLFFISLPLPQFTYPVQISITFLRILASFQLKIKGNTPGGF